MYSGGSVGGAALLNEGKADICVNWAGERPQSYLRGLGMLIGHPKGHEHAQSLKFGSCKAMRCSSVKVISSLHIPYHVCCIRMRTGEYARVVGMRTDADQQAVTCRCVWHWICAQDMIVKLLLCTLAYAVP